MKEGKADDGDSFVERSEWDVNVEGGVDERQIDRRSKRNSFVNEE